MKDDDAEPCFDVRPFQIWSNLANEPMRRISDIQIRNLLAYTPTYSELARRLRDDVVVRVEEAMYAVFHAAV